MSEIISTEQLNENTKNIDLLDAFGVVSLINQEDMKVALAVNAALPEIAVAVDIIADNFLSEGRLFYFGAGTSGRLGILDASECPPTYGTPPYMVQGIIAGGNAAIRTAVEGAEDSEELAIVDFNNHNIKANDTVVVISASGNASYITKILECAKKVNAKTVAITCNKLAKVTQLADCAICVETGAEAIAGSTRMKAGTAQKMVLNMLTTASMIRIGKVYQNYMIDVKPTNSKLKKRAIRFVSEIANVSQKEASDSLEKHEYKLKLAILNLKYGITIEESKKLLKKYKGVLRKVFNHLD